MVSLSWQPLKTNTVVILNMYNDAMCKDSSCFELLLFAILAIVAPF